MAVDRVSAPPEVQQAIRRAADAAGVDFTLLMETARRESGFNPAARAPTSSATGLFQFIERTWLMTVRRYGSEHGLGRLAARIDADGAVADPALRREILALRRDPEISARLAGELAKENAASLARALGRAPGAGELYAAHVLGPAGAARLVKAAAAGAPDAAALFPREAASNPWLFRENGAPRSAAALLARLDIAGDNVAPSGRLARGETPNADGPALAALIEAMFADLLRDALAPGGAGADVDPARAAAAYAQRLADV